MQTMLTAYITNSSVHNRNTLKRKPQCNIKVILIIPLYNKEQVIQIFLQKP